MSRGHNIASGADCKFTATGDLQNTDPRLAPLADNGGPVETSALRQGSPAVDAVAAAACPSTDARGVLRPAGGGCDIGAFEIATPAATTAPAAAFVRPQVPALQVNVWQAVSAPQSAATKHWTQEPAPLHFVPPD